MKYSCRLAVFFAFLTYIVVSFGCSAEPTYNPDQTFESEKWLKATQLYPQPEDAISEVKLIKYYENNSDRKNNKGRELGFMTKMRIVVPFKKWDEKYGIPGTDGEINLHSEDAYIHARLENGKVVKYEAIDKYIWEITNIEGEPMGMINDYGFVYKWNNGKLKMTYDGIGTVRSAILSLFNIKWDIYVEENDDNSYSIRGIDVDDQPVVTFNSLNVSQFKARFHNTANSINKSAYVDALLEDYKLENNLELYEKKAKSEDEFIDDDDDDDDEYLDDDDDDDDDDDWE